MNNSSRTLILLLLGVFILLFTASNSDAKQIRYHYIDLGTLGGEYSWGNGINNQGQMVGVSETEIGEYRGFLWNGEKMNSLPSLENYYISGAWAINDRGQTVGFRVNSDNQRRGLLWDQGGVHLLETLGGIESDAQGIGQNGEIVGWATTPDEILHAVLWDSEGIVDLDPLQTVMSWAWSINKKGDVVGAIVTPDYHLRAALWSDGTRVELGGLGGTDTEAFRINDKGQIVGWCGLPGGVWHACLWDRDGNPLDLGALDGLYSEAYSINDHGDVVGVYYTDSTFAEARPFLWNRKQGTVDLNALADLPEGVELVYALAINEFGWIAVTNQNGEACLLIPHKGGHKNAPNGHAWGWWRGKKK